MPVENIRAHKKNKVMKKIILYIVSCVWIFATIVFLLSGNIIHSLLGLFSLMCLYWCKDSELLKAFARINIDVMKRLGCY